MEGPLGDPWGRGGWGLGTTHGQLVAQLVAQQALEGGGVQGGLPSPPRGPGVLVEGAHHGVETPLQG